MTRLMLLDIDMLLFNLGLARKDGVPEFAPITEDSTFGGLFASPGMIDLESAKVSIREKIGLLLNDLCCSRWMFAVGGTGSFRKDLSKEYKSHRKERPEIVRELQAWALKEFRGNLLTSVPGHEADDTLGMAQDPYGGTIIVSGDKDFLQIPGYVYNYGTQRLIRNTPAMADSFLLYQVLAGDSADGYLGCPGIGEAKAHQILLRAWENLGHDMDSLWDVVKFTYLSQGSTEESFITMAQLAHIYRAGENAGIPWAPPNAMKKLKPSYIKLLKEITTC